MSEQSTVIADQFGLRESVAQVTDNHRPYVAHVAGDQDLHRSPPAALNGFGARTTDLDNGSARFERRGPGFEGCRAGIGIIDRVR
jgi:hypothetical protein